MCVVLESCCIMLVYHVAAMFRPLAVLPGRSCFLGSRQVLPAGGQATGGVLWIGRGALLYGRDCEAWSQAWSPRAASVHAAEGSFELVLCSFEHRR